jgi:hypothetical protein
MVKEAQLRRRRMRADTGSHDWKDRKVRDWLLLLLRFAITREPSDRSAALAAADELDSLSGQWRPSGPRFFLRTSEEVCTAIVSPATKHSNAALRRHIARIQNLRLKQAFEAALGRQWTAKPPQEGAKNKRRRGQDLWKGLRTR